MNADIKILFSSDFYKIIDFKCKCKNKCKSKSEFSSSFNISFVRRGNFIYNVFRNSYDLYNGYAIIDKPYSEHIVEHIHDIPDECTIFDFTDDFYESIKESYSQLKSIFFENTDRQSLLVKTGPEIEFVHYLILKKIYNENVIKFEMDNFVMDIFLWFISRIDNKKDLIRITPKLKKLHLKTIENAKDYINHNYTNDISLKEISDFCNISTFHFSRIFKKITNYSPYQFLIDTRLKNAELLIKNSAVVLKDICYLSGFNSPQHFNAAFKQKYGSSPSFYK